jgi:hypothetical protein
MLSPLDSAAAHAFDILRKQTKLSNDRGKRSPKTLLKIERFYIDAKLLERWFLKTLINLTYEKNSLIGTGGTEVGIPPKEL